MLMNQATPTGPCSPENHRHWEHSLLEETMSLVIESWVSSAVKGMESTRSGKGSWAMLPESDPLVPLLVTSPE